MTTAQPADPSRPRLPFGLTPPPAVVDLLGKVMPAFESVRRGSDAEAIITEIFGLCGVTINGTNPGDPQIREPRFYERVLRDATIGLGESYMDDWWEVDQLYVMITKLLLGDVSEAEQLRAKVKQDFLAGKY